MTVKNKKGWISLCVIFLLGCVLTGCSMEKKDPSKMHVAMITDSGDITDQSFNQQVYEACKDYCEKNKVDFTYKKPERATTADRVAMIDLAVAEGYNTLVCMGYGFNKVLPLVTKKYPDIKFVSADVSDGDMIASVVGQQYYDNPDAYRLEDYCYTDNLYVANYASHISGFCAGYAAVKAGYRQLGFLGGQAVPGVIQYGYGYLRGIDAAAEELGISDQIICNYAYAGQYFGSAEVTAVMDTWYSSGTEIVFACGGSVYTSAGESAAKYHGKVIGVDTDQSALIDQYQDKMTYTSALKRLDVTVNVVLSGIEKGEWDRFKGKREVIGLTSGTDMDQNAVGLPIGSTQWSDWFSLEDYKALIRKIYDGEISLSDSITEIPSVSFELKQRQGTIL